jgi:hypothetical protein
MLSPILQTHVRNIHEPPLWYRNKFSPAQMPVFSFCFSKQTRTRLKEQNFRNKSPSGVRPRFSKSTKTRRGGSLSLGLTRSLCFVPLLRCFAFRPFVLMIEVGQENRQREKISAERSLCLWHHATLVIYQRVYFVFLYYCCPGPENKSLQVTTCCVHCQ